MFVKSHSNNRVSPAQNPLLSRDVNEKKLRESMTNAVVDAFEKQRPQCIMTKHKAYDPKNKSSDVFLEVTYEKGKRLVELLTSIDLTKRKAQ